MPRVGPRVSSVFAFGTALPAGLFGVYSFMSGLFLTVLTQPCPPHQFAILCGAPDSTAAFGAAMFVAGICWFGVLVFAVGGWPNVGAGATWLSALAVIVWEFGAAYKSSKTGNWQVVEFVILAGAGALPTAMSAAGWRLSRKGRANKAGA